MSRLPPLLVFGLLASVFVVFVILLAYVVHGPKRTRTEISQAGIAALGGQCPICASKLKPVDLFAGRGGMSPYLIGAARCTKCGHLEIFSEEK